jgi:hypothetical protein
VPREVRILIQSSSVIESAVLFSADCSTIRVHAFPSCRTLFARSTWNKCGNSDPIILTARQYHIVQLAVFVFCPFTLASSRSADARIQFLPSMTTLCFRSTRSEQGNRDPILVTLRFYRILQLADSSSPHLPVCPFTRSMMGSKTSCHLL